MRKHVVCVLGVLLMFALRLRADTTVSDGSPVSFKNALTNGGTITVTTPIVISSTNGNNQSFDGGSNIIVSASSNSLFLVQDASLTLANFTLQNAAGTTNGGAIFVSAGGMLTATNCIFINNVVRGTNGTSFLSDTNDDEGDDDGSTKTPVTGKNGGRGSAAQSAFGGAIFNLGNASFLNCRFLTNSAIGGDGGDGEDGGDGANRGGNGGVGGAGGGAVGGAIYNSGSLLLVNSTFSGNVAQGGAGGMGGAAGSGFVNGAAGNGATAGDAAGGGLYSVNATATVLILNCTFNNNIAQGGAGSDGGVNGSGIGQVGRNGGNAFGGGIDNAGVVKNASSVTMTNSTFFENNAIGGTGGNGGNGGGRAGSGGNGGNAVGGGLYSAGTVSMVNCTFSKGAAIGGTNGAAGTGIAAGRNGKRGNSQGGNIANVAKKKAGTFTIANSVIGVSLSGGSASGTIIDGSYNICADKSIKFKKKGTSKANANPFLGDLADHGGPTLTIAFPTNSPVVDLIPPDNAPPLDQRGTNRPIEVFRDFSDVGAFELDPNAITIIQQPQSTNVVVATNTPFTVSFSVVAESAEPLFYQWYFAPTNVTIAPANLLVGQTNSLLLITNALLTNQGEYQVAVSNANETVASAVARLTITTITNSAPGITNQPESVTVNVGDTATFTVGATGTPTLFYQWQLQLNSTTFTNVPNGNSATLSITNVQTTNGGNYRVTITNNFGLTNSAVVTLFVTTNSSGNPNPNPDPNPFSANNAPAVAVEQPALVPLATEQNGGAPAAMNFTFSSETGATYVIEYKQSLTDSDWVPIATNSGTGEWITNRVLMTNRPSGFYRAIRR